MIFLRKLVMPTVFLWCFRTRSRGRFRSTAGHSLENRLHSVIRWRAVCTAFSGQLQISEDFLFISCRYERKLPWFVRNCVRMKLGQRVRESLWKMVGMNFVTSKFFISWRELLTCLWFYVLILRGHSRNLIVTSRTENIIDLPFQW